MSRHQPCSTSAILARPWSPGLREPVSLHRVNSQYVCTVTFNCLTYIRQCQWYNECVLWYSSWFIGNVWQNTNYQITYYINFPIIEEPLISEIVYFNSWRCLFPDLYVLFATHLGIASDGLKGRVFEVSLADLQNDEVAFRKFKLITEDVQGKNCLTNFHGMDLTRDKMCSMVKKWQVVFFLWKSLRKCNSSQYDLATIPNEYFIWPMFILKLRFNM